MTEPMHPELARLVRLALERDASDLFLIPGEPPALRLRGHIERLEDEVLGAEEVRAMAAAAIGEEDLAKVGTIVGEFRRWCGVPGEHNVSLCIACAHGDYTIAARIMPSRLLNVEEMEFPRAMVEAASCRHGLIVVSGAVGSGKTTGLYGLVEHLNAHRADIHICTVEGPNHMYITPKKALVQQREIGVDVPSALAGIKAAINQDADVLLIGEVTSVEELQACITAAEMGHLVLTQLHCSTPEAAIRRMIEVFPEDMREASRKALAGVLRAVSAQCLLSRKGGKGRVAAYGVLIPDDEMREAIAAGRDFLARKTPLPEGCQNLREHIERLRDEGFADEESARKALEELGRFGAT